MPSWNRTVFQVCCTMWEVVVGMFLTFQSSQITLLNIMLTSERGWDYNAKQLDMNRMERLYLAKSSDYTGWTGNKITLAIVISVCSLIHFSLTDCKIAKKLQPAKGNQMTFPMVPGRKVWPTNHRWTTLELRNFIKFIHSFMIVVIIIVVICYYYCCSYLILKSQWTKRMKNV